MSARSQFKSRSSLAASLALTVWGSAFCAARADQPGEPPALLSQTGLYARIANQTVAADALPFAPQYPLWTDGAAKRRWIRLPPGAFIDASDPAAWVFPAGTKLWKEFAFGGRRVETRYMEKQSDGAWTFATYAWTDDGKDAERVSQRGRPNAVETRGGAPHDLPSVADCRVCHLGRPSGVLGFDALQLSTDRDPNALHQDPVPAGGVELAMLVSRGLVRNLPRHLIDRPPRIPARTPRERAALGYFVGNCSSCHRTSGSLAALGLSFEHDLNATTAADEPALRTALGKAGSFALPGQQRPAVRLVPGAPEQSAVLARIGSRDPAVQMPPLGTHLIDDDAAALVAGWIRDDLRKPAARRLAASHAKSPNPEGVTR